MPRYYRRRWRPRRRYRRWFRRRLRRFVNGSSKSTIRVKVPVHFNYSITTASATPTHSDVMCIAPFFKSDTSGSALSSPLYRTYCDLYDEVKCIGGKIRLNVSSPVGGSEIPSLQIYTAWDRRNGFTNTGGATQHEYPTVDNMMNMSTASVATAVNNSVAKLERALYASDLLEKAQWHDSSLASAAGVYSDRACCAAGDNPNFFHPGFYYFFRFPGATAQKALAYSFDIVWYFSFRNPKYGAGAGSSRLETESLDWKGPTPTADSGDMDIDVAALPDDYELNVDTDPLGQETVDAAAARIAVDREPVTSVSFSRAMHNQGVVTAAHQAALNRAERRRLEGKNV